MTIPAVVALNEFEYVHFQGEDGYRIYRTASGMHDPPIAFAYDIEQTELNIVELWLDDQGL